MRVLVRGCVCGCVCAGVYIGECACVWMCVCGCGCAGVCIGVCACVRRKVVHMFFMQRCTKGSKVTNHRKKFKTAESKNKKCINFCFELQLYNNHNYTMSYQAPCLT